MAMDLHEIRAHQGTFSPSPSSNPTSNPDITITGSQTRNSPTVTTFLYAPNPLLPQPRSILKSIPWGTEDLNSNSQSQTSTSPTTRSFSSPLASPSHLLPSHSQTFPSNPHTQTTNRFALPMPVPGAVGAGGIGGGLGGGFMGNYEYVQVRSTRRLTPYRGFAYTPTRPSTGRLSRLTIGDPERPCGVGCWIAFLLACCAILGLGGMWLFQVSIFAHHEWPAPVVSARGGGRDVYSVRMRMTV